jgi:hypothetical membrane protein
MQRIGAFCWALASAVLLCAHLVAQAAWTTPYSWAGNNVSDLGNVHCGPWGDDRRYVCSPLHGWMNAGLVLTGVLLAVGAVLLERRAGRVLLVAGAAGWILAGLVPADVNENVHVLGAVLIFGAGNVGLLVARGGYPRRTAGVVGLLAAVLFLSRHYAGPGMGGMERIAAFAAPVWMTVAGVGVFARMGGRGREAAVRTSAS